MSHNRDFNKVLLKVLYLLFAITTHYVIVLLFICLILFCAEFIMCSSMVGQHMYMIINTIYEHSLQVIVPLSPASGPQFF